MSVTAEQEGYLEVPGARLFYKVRGSGPVLLILEGGAGDADSSDGLAAALGDRYTVAGYDRRGLSRSTVEDPDAPISAGTHSDDASRLLAAVTDEPALVFGCSLGALIGLDLVATRPGQVRTLVAHEAPLADLLDEPGRGEFRERQRDVDATFATAGLLPAMRKFRDIAGVVSDDPDPEVTVARPSDERIAQHMANMEFFLAHGAPYAHRYALDPAALTAVSGAIVPAAGVLSRGSLPYRCAQSLAGLLGRELREFPGNHVGYVARPRAFAAELHRVITPGNAG